MVKKLFKVGVDMAKGYLLTLGVIFALWGTIIYLSPTTLWYEYVAIVPTKKTYCVGERPSFRSYGKVNRVPITMYWNEIQFCNLDSVENEGYKPYYNSNLSERNIKETFDRTKDGRLRYYDGTVVNEPATCYMEHDIKAIVDLFIPKRQTVIGAEYRYEYCITTIYTGELQGE